MNILAVGTVLEPITINEGSDLSFGSVYPGEVKTISYSNIQAAEFVIDGEPGKTITADFTLPSSLTHTGNSLYTLTISFGATDSGYNTSDDPSGATDHDPGTTLTTLLGSTEGLLYVWLGGSVEPTLLQEKGDYIGDIVLDAAYTGN